MCARPGRAATRLATLSLMLSLALALALALAVDAIADTRVPLTVRRKPSPSAKVIFYAPAGSRPVALGRRSTDGMWLEVKIGKRAGWVLASELRDADPDAFPADAAPRSPAAGPAAASSPGAPVADDAHAANPRRVRPEVWIAESRYHDGQGPARIQVARSRVDLLARPQAGSQTIGMARRDEQMVVVRASRDGKWYLVELGAGELGWIDAAAVKVLGAAPLAAQVSPTGEDTTAPAPSIAPAAPPTPTATDPSPSSAATAPPTVEATPPPVANPPVDPRATPSARSRRGHRGAGAPVAAAAPPRVRAIDEEAAADTSGGGAPSSTDGAAEATLRAGVDTGSRFRVAALAGAGYSTLGAHFTSNAHGNLSNFDAGTGGLGAEAALDASARLSGRLTVDLSLAYRFAGAADVKLHAAGGDVVLGMQSHAVELLGALGRDFDLLGGVTVSVAAGGLMLVSLVDQNPKALLPSDRALALAIGARLDAPSLWRALGATLEARLYPLGTRAETSGIDEGQPDSTFGFTVAGALGWRLGPALAASVGARYTSLSTHFTGKSERNPAITAADRTTSLMSLAVDLTYSR